MRRQQPPERHRTLNKVKWLLRTIDTIMTQLMTQQGKMDRTMVWIGYKIKYILVYKQITFARNRVHRLLRPYVLPPGLVPDVAGVYVLVADSFYIGMTVSTYSRLFEHIRDSKLVSRYGHRRGTEGLIHQDMARRGVGRYTMLYLTAQQAEPGCPRTPEGKRMLQDNIRKQEAWFIHNLARSHSHTLNIVGTWQQRRIRWRARELIHLHALAPPTAGTMSATRAHNGSFTNFSVQITNNGEFIRSQDLYTILHAMSKQHPTPAQANQGHIRVQHGSIDASRYNSIRYAYHTSTMIFQYSDGRVPQVVMGAEINMMMVTPPLTHITVHTATRRQRTAPLEARKTMARLTFDKPFERLFERKCTLLQMHRFYKLATHMHKPTQAARRSRLARIGRRKFGMHPNLRLTLRIQTPRTATRQQILDAAKSGIIRHGTLPKVVNTIIAARLRLVLTRPRRILDIFDNVRKYCAGWDVRAPRGCTCKDIAGIWRHPTTQ